MSSLPSIRRAGHFGGPSVRRVAICLALLVGLGGLALGAHALATPHLAGQNEPRPTTSSAAAALDSATPTPAASSVTPSADQPSLSASATAPATVSVAAKVTAKSAPRTVTTTSAPKAATTSVRNAASYEQQVLTLTNAQRAAAGCPALVMNSTLSGVARSHSQDMAAKGYFDHNSLDGTTPAQRLTAAGYTYRQMAENIAAGQSTPADVMTSWMGSAGHKANILNCSLKELGVGFATGGPYGTYWTQDFGTR